MVELTEEMNPREYLEREIERSRIAMLQLRAELEIYVAALDDPKLLVIDAESRDYWRQKKARALSHPSLLMNKDKDALIVAINNAYGLVSWRRDFLSDKEEARLVSPDTAAVSDANSAGRPSPTRPRTDTGRVSEQFVPLLGCSASHISLRRLIAASLCRVCRLCRLSIAVCNA